MTARHELGPARGQSLVDVLDRILEKGLVIAGDIRLDLADVELLTIRIRLLVCSIDKAEEIGLDWWKADPYLSSRALRPSAIAELEERLERLDDRLETVRQRQRELEG